MNKLLWDKDKTIKLIHLYGENRLLWDPTEKDYKNRNKKKEAVSNIAAALKISVEEYNKKVNSLLTQYRRERLLLHSKIEKGIQKVKTPWFAYKYFNFLNIKNSPNYVRSNIAPATPFMFNEAHITTDSDDNANNTQLDIETSLSKVDCITINDIEENILNDSQKDKFQILSTSQSRDELKLFGEMVEQRLRNFKDRRKLITIKHQIEILLYNAELEMCDAHPKSTSSVSSYTFREKYENNS